MVIDLKEFLRKYQNDIYTFCYYLLKDDQVSDTIICQIFEKFTKKFFKSLRNLTNEELKIELYKCVIEEINVFYRYKQTTHCFWKEPRSKVLDERRSFGEELKFVNSDFRIILVLHDIIQLSDEEIMKILSLRWGVFRHRLHRARLELIQALRNQKHQSVLSDGEVIEWQ